MFNDERSLRILVIGAQPPPIGGATLLVQDLIDELQKRPDIEVFTVNLSRVNNNALNIFWIALQSLWHTLWLGRRSDVITLHVNRYGRLVFGPIVFFLSRLLRKPLIVRAFGGTFDQQFLALPKFIKWLMLHTYLNAEVCLLETKRMVTFFQSLCIRRAEWFPNYTHDAGLTNEIALKARCSRFVFIGRITPTKGIEQIIEASALLDEGVTVDLYGPLDAPYTFQKLNVDGDERARYQGLLSKEEVKQKLWDYDALVLPTYWFGEGYPAVILEAYAHGLPVIATRWQSIPEIVDEKSGILITPRDSQDLANAMNQLHRQPEYYATLQQGARDRIGDFRAVTWLNFFVKICHEVAQRS